MSIVKYQTRPSLFNSFFDDFMTRDMFNHPSHRAHSGFRPAVNVKEDEKSYGLEMIVPGFNKEDFSLNVKDGVITIKGEHKVSNEEQKEKYTRREFAFRSFERSFSLPEEVNVEGIGAKYENGVLHITLPKQEKVVIDNSRQIEIR